LQHELRRVMDAIERNRNRELERHEARLRDAIGLCERELRQRARALQSPADRA